MKRKRCRNQLHKNRKQSGKCGANVTQKKYVFKCVFIGGVLLLLYITSPILGVVGGAVGAVAGDIALHMSFAGFVGFFNRMNGVAEYEYLCEKYPFFVPAQQKLLNVQLAAAEDCDGYLYPYEGAVERLEGVDPYISAPNVQAQLDEQIAYYEGLVQQAKDDLYEMIMLENQFDTPSGKVLETAEMPEDTSFMDSRYYVEWDGKIYFRQYDSDALECYSEEFPYGYTGLPMDENKIMCVDEKGEVSFVCKDAGFGPFYIMDVPEEGPRIYGIRINQEQCWEVYSCDLTGSDINVIHATSQAIAYGEPVWLTFVECYDNNIIFTKNNIQSSHIINYFYCIETDNENYIETLRLNTSNVSGRPNGNPFAYGEDCVYLWDGYNDGFVIRRVTYENEKEILIHIPEEEIFPENKTLGDYYINISQIEFIDNYLCFQLTFLEDETEEILWNTTIILDTENEACTYIPSGDHLDYQVVQQGDNLWIYYYDTDEECKIRTISGCVQVAGTDVAPVGVNPYAEVGAVTMAYNENGQKELIATPDYTGYSYVVLTDDEVQNMYNKLFLNSNDDAESIQWNYLYGECVDDKLFFCVEFESETIMQGDFSRNSYQFYKDLKSGEIKLLEE